MQIRFLYFIRLMDSQLPRPEELSTCAGSYRQCSMHLWAAPLEPRECPSKCNRGSEETRKNNHHLVYRSVTAAGLAECHRAFRIMETDSRCLPRLLESTALILCSLIAKVGLSFLTRLDLRHGPEYKTTPYTGQQTMPMLNAFVRHWKLQNTAIA